MKSDLKKLSKLLKIAQLVRIKNYILCFLFSKSFKKHHLTSTHPEMSSCFDPYIDIHSANEHI